MPRVGPSSGSARKKCSLRWASFFDLKQDLHGPGFNAWPVLFGHQVLIHPTLRILGLIILAFVIQLSSQLSLLLLGGVVLLVALVFYPRLLRSMLRRSRWLLFTLLLIYAFTTPGEYPAWWALDFAPTYEGIAHGAIQAGRLAVMLAGLAILLGSTPRDALMAGIFLAVAPMRWLGFSPERFASRLWLTLHYVEEGPVHVEGAIWSHLDRIGIGKIDMPVEKVQFPLPRIGALDWLLLTAVAVLLCAWRMW